MIWRRKTNYEKSNATSSVDFPISSSAIMLTKQLLTSKATAKRQRLGDALLDELADLAAVDIVKLKISDAKQWHKKYKGRTVMKQYGYYKPDTKYIYVHNRTAVRGQLLAAKTFLDTLLHEWIHHYDHQKLKLNSIHTKGFYERLRDLKVKLDIPIGNAPGKR